MCGCVYACVHACIMILFDLYFVFIHVYSIFNILHLITFCSTLNGNCP